MTTLEIVLIIILYIVGIPASYNTFKKICLNNWTDTYKLQLIVWPFMWVGLFILAFSEGWKYIWNNTMKST